MRNAIKLFAFTTIALYSSIAFSEDYDAVSALHCRAVYDSQTGDIGRGGYMSPALNLNSSQTREVICPLHTSNNNGTRTKIDKIEVLFTDTDSTCWLYKHYWNGMSDGGSIYSPNSSGSGVITFSTDRALKSAYYPYDYSVRCWISPNESLSQIKVYYKQ